MTAWIQTYTGKKFYPTEDDPGEIDIRDIAHALANMCRFAGHCRRFYSVAQHSVLMCRVAPDALKPYALLHDAAEAYLCDVPRPLKALPELAGLVAHEKRLQRLIYERFGLDPDPPPTLKELDNRMLATEVVGLMGEADWGHVHGEPFHSFLRGNDMGTYDPHDAERDYLGAAEQHLAQGAIQ